MANIIDAFYFIGDIEIPNVNQEEIADDLLHSINLYEKEVLISLLGYTLYKELRAHTVVAGDKFDKLINGEDFSFTVNGATVETHWNGLKGENKKSLIAYYVYFMHRRKRASYHAGTGMEVEAKTDNSNKGSLYTKLIEVWNDFITMYEGCGEDILSTLYLYSPNFLYHRDDLPSAYNYLVAKKADFPTWRFESLGGEINRFGI